MFLRSAHIRHYKSLDDVRVEFTQPITVIVGPNAVGKSNFVDALRFAGEMASAANVQTRREAVQHHGGIERIRSRATAAGETVSIALDMDTDSGSGHAGVILEPAGQQQYAARVGVQPASLSEEVFPHWRLTSLYPNTLRQLTTAQPDDALADDGANWASIVKRFKRTASGRSVLHRIGDTMRCVIPNFLDIKVRSVGSYLVPHFVFSADGKSVEFDATQVSDGTLRIFGLLLAIYQLPAPTLLVIEEPEHTVYPGALGVLVDAMREVSEQTQIILTTHSPDLVHYFKPDEIRVATIENGHTRIAPICTPQRAAIDEHLMTAEDFMRAEGLQPEPAQKPAA